MVCFVPDPPQAALEILSPGDMMIVVAGAQPGLEQIPQELLASPSQFLWKASRPTGFFAQELVGAEGTCALCLESVSLD